MTVRVVVFYFFFVCFFYVFCCGAECYAQKPVGARQFGGDFFYGRMVYERLSVFAVGGGVFATIGGVLTTGGGVLTTGGGVLTAGGGVLTAGGGVLTMGGGFVLFCRGTELLFCIFFARAVLHFFTGGGGFYKACFEGFAQ